MATLELTEQEGQAILNLIDIAIKATGLAQAETGVVLVKKIQAAFSQKEEPEILDKKSNPVTK